MKKGIILGIILISLVLLPINTSSQPPVVDLTNDVPLDYFFEVAQGNVPGARVIHKFGRNPDVDTASAFEDIWDIGGTYSFLTTAEKLNISSTSTDDDGAGSGARIIEVFGLDNNHNEISENVTLDGTTVNQTIQSFLRTNRMVVHSAGSGETNAGDITATTELSNVAQAQVMIGEAQTLMSLYTVPAGKTGYVQMIYSSLSKKQSAFSVIKMRVKPFGEVFQTKQVFGDQTDGSTSVDITFQTPIVVSARSDISFVADASVNDLQISVNFDIILIDE